MSKRHEVRKPDNIGQEVGCAEGQIGESRTTNTEVHSGSKQEMWTRVACVS